MKIRLALAAHNTEKCFENKVFGLNLIHSKVIKSFLETKNGDILVFYKAKEGLAGIWKVVSEPYTDHSQIWEDGEYSSRVKIEPVIYLQPDQYISPKTMVDELELIKYPQYWGMYFRENLKEVSQKDYELIKSKLGNISK